MTRALLSLATLALAACGNLDNTPFRVGQVRGALEGADAQGAYVAVLERPDLGAPVEADGRFVLERVPAGDRELFVVGGAAKARRLKVKVRAGRAADVGTVALEPGGFVDLRVFTRSHQRVDQTHVSVAGTPLRQLPVDAQGRVGVGPLAFGCYRLDVSAPGFPLVSVDVCVGKGERRPLEVELTPPGDDYVNRGCSVTGCEAGTYCAGDGRCVECLNGQQCGEGLGCVASRCEGPGPVCGACNGDWQCAAGTRCEQLAGGEPACVAPCAADGSCGAGLTCESGRCVPQPEQMSGCGGWRAVGSPCAQASECQARGLVNGACVAGQCTYACSGDAACPSDFACQPATPPTGGSFCTARP